MGDLPAVRVTLAGPFTTDPAGPILTKEMMWSKPTLKSYISISVCFAAKAIHLQVAMDLSTDAFLNCLRTFTSRRSLPQCIMSDNDTNFVSARNELGKLLRSSNHKGKVAEFLATEHIEWRLNPAPYTSL